MQSPEVDTVRVALVTFTSTEKSAIVKLLADLSPDWKAEAPTHDVDKWQRGVSHGTLVVHHFEQNAQGNLAAATKLAALRFGSTLEYQFFVFYGCAAGYGTSRGATPYLVRAARYAGLGKVTAPKTDQDSTPAERFRLKTKWMFPVAEKDTALDDPLPAADGRVDPFKRITFPLVDRLGLPELPRAAVLSTEAVVDLPDVPPAGAPEDKFDVEASEFTDDLLTFAETIAYAQSLSEDDLLVDMETYGIASIMLSLGLRHRVLVVRVPTDSNGDKANQPKQKQAQLLAEEVTVLESVLLTLKDMPDYTEDEDSGQVKLSGALIDSSIFEAIDRPDVARLMLPDVLGAMKLPDMQPLLGPDTLAAIESINIAASTVATEIRDFAALADAIEMPDLAAILSTIDLPDMRVLLDPKALEVLQARFETQPEPESEHDAPTAGD